MILGPIPLPEGQKFVGYQESNPSVELLDAQSPDWVLLTNWE